MGKKRAHLIGVVRVTFKDVADHALGKFNLPMAADSYATFVLDFKTNENPHYKRPPVIAKGGGKSL